jgi:predicted DNA-binding transcriptional regulator AlpA
LFRGLLRPPQVAAYLNISPAQLDLLRTSDHFPASLLLPSDRNPSGAARTTLWDIRDLDAWIDDRREQRRMARKRRKQLTILSAEVDSRTAWHIRALAKANATTVSEILRAALARLLDSATG